MKKVVEAFSSLCWMHAIGFAAYDRGDDPSRILQVRRIIES